MKGQVALKGKPKRLAVLDYGLFEVHAGPRTIGICGYLIETDADERILIDTGLPGDRDPARINQLAREIAGLERIDHLVITHFDLDHFGGAADLSKLIPIGTVYDNGGALAERLKKLHDA